MRERIAAERVERHRVALPIEARASALIRTLIANGTTRTRSHVDIDNDVGLANLEAVLARARGLPGLDRHSARRLPAKRRDDGEGRARPHGRGAQRRRRSRRRAGSGGLRRRRQGPARHRVRPRRAVRQGNRHSSARRRRDRRCGASRHRRADDRRRACRGASRSATRSRSGAIAPDLFDRDRRRARPR